MTWERRADILLILTALIAACGWIFSRETLNGMPVFAFLGARFLCAALVLLPLQQIAGGILILLAQVWYRARTLARLPGRITTRG